MTVTLPIATDAQADESPAADDAPFTWPLVRVLRELGDVVGALSDASYATRSSGPVTGSIGAHVRHCLDHVDALLESATSGVLDYDRRHRGLVVETDRTAALGRIDWIIQRFMDLDELAKDRAVLVRALLTPDGRPTEMLSSVGRELAYVVSHTIHHNAIIAALVRSVGGEVPRTFGYAPATLAAAGGGCIGGCPCAR